jgi:hypothetical protein
MFSGTVSGMSVMDTIDFTDLSFASLQRPVFSATATGGVLSLTDGTHAANIQLVGNYTGSSFVASGDASSGSLIQIQQSSMITSSQHA